MKRKPIKPEPRRVQGRKVAVVLRREVDFQAALQESLDAPPQPETLAEAKEDAEKAIDTAARIRKQTKADKACFDAAHQKGMDALRRGDHETLSDAIAEEKALIDRAATRATVMKRRG